MHVFLLYISQRTRGSVRSRSKPRCLHDPAISTRVTRCTHGRAAMPKATTEREEWLQRDSLPNALDWMPLQPSRWCRTKVHQREKSCSESPCTPDEVSAMRSKVS